MDADLMTEELKQTGNMADFAGRAPTMGAIQKLRYSHAAMIDLIISNPEISQNSLAARFGYTPSWISNVMASDAFQEALAKRREEVVDPILRATLQERTRALYLQSLAVLQAKLEAPQVSDKVALAAAELGAKALGIGGHAPAAPVNGQSRLVVLAQNLIALQSKAKGEVHESTCTEIDPTTAAS